MAEEFQQICEGLSRLGLHQTLETFKKEIKSKKVYPSSAIRPPSIVIPDEDSSLLTPFSIAQPVTVEPSPCLTEDLVKANSLDMVSGGLPAFVIDEVHDLRSLKTQEIFPRDLEAEDPSTPVSFSPKSCTSNTSTIIVSGQQFVQSPDDSPFAQQQTFGFLPEEPYPFRNVDSQEYTDSMEEGQSPQFRASVSQGGFARVNSLNDVGMAQKEQQQHQQQKFCALKPDSISFAQELNSGVKSTPHLDVEEKTKGNNNNNNNGTTSISSPQMVECENNFSFPPTPPGSETGTNAALKTLRSLKSQSFSDLHSTESGTTSSKPKSVTIPGSSRAASSGLECPSGSSHSADSENPKESLESLNRAKHREKIQNMKRVSLTLMHNGFNWGPSIDHESTCPAVDEQNERIVPTDQKYPFKKSSHIQEREYSFPLYPFSQEYIDETYDLINLKIYHKKGKTGFESSKDLYVDRGDVIAGRYQVIKVVGSAVFSKAIKALDLKETKQVCLKMVKNVKDYFDQSLDEIKLLRYLNGLDPSDTEGVVRLLDYFYYREHLFLVFELLQQNLFEIQQQSLRVCQSSSSEDYYFSIKKIQSVAQQLLTALCFLHENSIIHSDLKPENILMKDTDQCAVKVIDLGSSCFVTDYLGSYVQSRSYRAPEVVLGVPYDQKVDIWSLGCILVELFTGQVLFQTSTLAELMMKIEQTNGPVPKWMIKEGSMSHQYYTSSGKFYKQQQQQPTMPNVSLPHGSEMHSTWSQSSTRTFQGERQPDQEFSDFISQLLTIDPSKRPTALELCQHSWFMHKY